MAKISLNIYGAKNKTKLEKTLEVEGYDLMLGTVEDFMEIIDIDKLGDQKEVAKMVVKGYSQIKPLLMDIFPELTDDEYKRIKVSDLVRVITQLGTAVIEQLDILKTKN